ncbi:MAG: hypothetical protein V7640_1034, partial [Betaproteobacteria bacterium]
SRRRRIGIAIDLCMRHERRDLTANVFWQAIRIFHRVELDHAARISHVVAGERANLVADDVFRLFHNM